MALLNELVRMVEVAKLFVLPDSPFPQLAFAALNVSSTFPLRTTTLRRTHRKARSSGANLVAFLAQRDEES